MRTPTGLPTVNYVDPGLVNSTSASGPVPDRGMLIEKICRLQRTNARKQEKLEYTRISMVFH